MKPPNTPIDNTFSLLLQHQRSGDCQAELSEKLRQLCLDVTALGKKGTLTLTVTVTPTGRGAGTAITVTDKIAVKPPLEEQPNSIFFVGNDGELSRSDPRQRELPFSAIDGGKRDDTQPATVVSKAS